MSIKFHDIRYKEGKVDILRGISADIKPGELVAVMGPSGSGKTSLLSVLSGRNSNYTGTITCAGLRPANIKSEIGFVKQTEMLFGDLTVEDTLYYGVRLRCPHLSRDEQDDRIKNTVGMLNISHILNRKIGDIGKKVLSGGEKKRVSIAMELVAQPVILFLDEPTSGLDATAAVELILNLKNLSQLGTTIVCTIHQPGRQLYKIFDKLLFIMNGNLVYYGVPQGIKKSIKAMVAPYKIKYDKYSHPVDCIVKTSNEDSSGKIQSLLSIKNYDEDRFCNEEKIEETEVNLRPRLDFFSALLILTRRALTQTWRNKFDIADIISIISIVTFQSIIWYQRINKTAFQVLHETIIYSFIAIISLYRPGYTSIFFFTTDKPIIKHELEYGSYSIGTYYLAKIIADAPFLAIPPTCFLIVLYFTIGFPLVFESFMFLYVVILTHSYTSNAIGLLISVFCGDSERAAKILDGVLPLLALTCMMWSKSLPMWIAWISYLSPMAAAYEAIYSNHLQYFIPTGNATLSAPVNFWFKEKWYYFILIAAWNIFYRTAACFALILTLKHYHCCKYKKKSK